MPETHVHELISHSLDGTLSPAEERVLEAHLETCAECREEAIQVRELNDRLRHPPMMEPGEGFAERVMARLDAREASVARYRWIFVILVFAGSSLALSVWLWFNFGAFLDSAASLLAAFDAVLPILLDITFAVVERIGDGPLLVYALIVLVLTFIWARAASGFAHTASTLNP